MIMLDGRHMKASDRHQAERMKMVMSFYGDYQNISQKLQALD